MLNTIFFTLCLGQSVAKIDGPVDLQLALPEIRNDRQVRSLNLAEYQGKHHLVMFFLSEQCGVTYFYKSRIQKLEHDFMPLGFKFIGVRCGQREDPKNPIDLPETRTLQMPFVDDEKGQLMRQFSVGQSATFVVIDPSGKLRYLGGLDDQVKEADAKKPFLRNAMRELSRGKNVTVKEGKAVGCAIIPIEGA